MQARGIKTAPKTKGEHIAESPTDAKFVKDLLRATWTDRELRNRSLSGVPCRRFVKMENAKEPRTALTPEKVCSIRGMCECAQIYPH